MHLEKKNIPLTAPKCELSNTIIILSDSEDENSPQAKKVEDIGLICVNEDKVPLYERDLNCLNSTGILGWLNETVITYTLNMLKSKYKNRDVYLFSPFFFTRLYQAATNEKERNFKALKNWFRGVDLFNIPLWLIPIFQRHHWFLIAVTNITHKNFHIICMDSLGKDRTKCLELIKIFFEKKYYHEGHTGKWHPPKFLTPKIPLQTNFNDCGLHLIRSAELFLNNKKKTMQMAMVWERKKYITFQIPDSADSFILG
ncbi:MAG: hypothetical protein EXX96DRAFT_110308 [Benjaminiella poitrasii]|nr:MAG: hypothetical protein EXX96DRAFT_110308 [Benjaminiella poitrasii]